MSLGQRLPKACAALGCLLLTVCAGQTTTVTWVKSGADDQTVARELERWCDRQPDQHTPALI